MIERGAVYVNEEIEELRTNERFQSWIPTFGDHTRTKFGTEMFHGHGELKSLHLDNINVKILQATVDTMSSVSVEAFKNPDQTAPKVERSTTLYTPRMMNIFRLDTSLKNIPMRYQTKLNTKRNW